MNPQPEDLILLGKRVHVWTGGTGPALLLLHSAWGDAEMSWGTVWNELSAFFTIVAPDLPGFGKSEHLDNVSLAANAGVLNELLDHQKLDRAVVVGNSFGVAIAIEFATLYPERTHHLVTVNGGYLPALPRFIKKLISLPGVEKRFRALMRNMTYSDKAFARAFPDPSRLPPGLIDHIRQNEEKQSRIVFDTFMKQAKPQTPPSVPSTIIWGTGDRLVSMRQAEAIRKWHKTARYVTINGAGHMPQVENPEEFVAAMKPIGAY
jgi:pimeloyl-ACP methyl ester carboxylesterase